MFSWFVIKALLTGFTQHKLIDNETFALENATLWVFAIIFGFMMRNVHKKYLGIVRKLSAAIEEYEKTAPKKVAAKKKIRKR
jgi:hypothetical protein